MEIDMNKIKVTRAVPLSEAILLLVVENQANGKMDAIILVTSSECAMQPGYIERLEQTISLPDDIQSSQYSEAVSFEIDKNLYDRTEKWCSEEGISFEQLVLAFIRFCACANNHTALKEWFSPKRIAAELCSTIAELLCVQAELLEIKTRFGIDNHITEEETNALLS